MPPLWIGVCLKAREIETHRDWLFDAERDIELQDFGSYKALTAEFEDRISAARAALEGHSGRRDIHGPYEGLDMENKDPELRPLITARYLKALEAADRIGARQMVLHSPYERWYAMNRLARPGYADNVLERVHAIMDPVVQAAEDKGITLVIENILMSTAGARWSTVSTLLPSRFRSTRAMPIWRGGCRARRRWTISCVTRATSWRMCTFRISTAMPTGTGPRAKARFTGRRCSAHLATAKAPRIWCWNCAARATSPLDLRIWKGLGWPADRARA